MPTNAQKYATHTRPDKVRFIFRGMDPQQAIEHHQRWVAWCVDNLQWSEGYAMRHVRVMPYHRGKERKGVILQLTWRACELCYTLPLSWMQRVHEVEVKTYLVEHGPDSYEQFVDALEQSEGRLALHIYYPGAHSSPSKGRRTRKADLGSRKSETNVKAYKRPKERPGLEVTARGRKAAKVAAEVVEYGLAGYDPEQLARLWRIFFERCARLGFINLTLELTRRGMDLADYFAAFTDVEDERYDVPVDDLNAVSRREEEAAQSKFI